jgi:hypothetical protein
MPSDDLLLDAGFLVLLVALAVGLVAIANRRVALNGPTVIPNARELLLRCREELAARVPDDSPLVCECGHDINSHVVLDRGACHLLDCPCHAWRQVQ